jgi:hypothetical protein
VFALFLIACGALKIGVQVGERCESPCAVALQHPLLPDGQEFATFTLQDGDLVTAAQADLGSVTLLHPRGRKGMALAESILHGETPAAMADMWVLVMDAQGVVHEHGVRPEGIRDLKLNP